MITTQAALMTAIAAAVAFWPKIVEVAKVIPIPKVPATAVSYQSAMIALATVRARLLATGGPSAAANDAITAITQELVSGSDK